MHSLFMSSAYKPLHVFYYPMPKLVLSVLHKFIFFLLFFKDFIYLFMRDTHREAETQAEGEAGSMQGAQHGTQSRGSRITPWAEGGTKPLSHPGCPPLLFLQAGNPISHLSESLITCTELG